ncbi:MAG: type II toxin-antitoxin system HicB family antitoxin [Oscillospiraceae bacterium]|jgi:predicted RNase H-like HicB family nuclease|nr:type II toxin-antitoxin system HicB family antitoxin [Oscillospiraceae bacterium]
MKYVYPAVFVREASGLYAINFPDLESCYTTGQGWIDGCAMASDVLSYCLYDMEREGKRPPNPSSPEAISASNKGVVALIPCDTEDYHKRDRTKSVKKTLTIPQWLNVEAERAGVNFSLVLQNGLKELLRNAE